MHREAIKAAARLLSPHLTLGLTALEVQTLVLHITELATARCTCSSLLHGSPVRCMLHPETRARTPDERMDFEREFDRNLHL